jgi:hypothetical protein
MMICAGSKGATVSGIRLKTYVPAGFRGKSGNVPFAACALAFISHVALQHNKA